jgi:RecA-family ATPase
MQTINSIHEHHRQRTDEQARQAARRHVYSILSARDIFRMQMPEIDWFVPGLIASGLTTLAGQSTAGKSWLLLQLGLAISAGSVFIGSLCCRKADVLYLALEDNNWRMQSRLRKLGLDCTRNLFIDTANKVTPDNIEIHLDEMPTVQMVIVDTLGRYFASGQEKIDGNDYNENTKAVGKLHTVAKERGIAMVVCTHTRKGAVQDDNWVDSIMGSKALVAVSDTVLMLTRKMETTVGQLKITGRDVLERTIEMEHTENWLWYDKNAEQVTPLAEFSQFGVCPKCNGEGVWGLWEDGKRVTRRCDCVAGKF